MIIFTSDNGPWTLYGNHAGKTPFREAKGTSFDGGIRSPLLIKYPPLVKAGKISNSTYFSIDLFPTLTKLSGTKFSHEVDGKDVMPIMSMEKEAVNPHKYRRVGHFGKGGKAGKYIYPKVRYSLFDLKNAPYEKKNVILSHPVVARKLKKWAKYHLKKFYKNSVTFFEKVTF